MVDKQMFKTAFESANTGKTFTDYFDSSCCNTDNCNNQTLTTPPTPTTALAMASTPGSDMQPTSSTKPTTESHASNLFPFNGILAFAVIVIGVILF